jgi:signal transduction histidine kinase
VGEVVAAVEHDAAIVASSITRYAMMTSIGMALLRHARQVEADQRTAEVRRVQRQVLDSQDRTRRRLERNLHDGLQQRLVALSLEASMMARHESAGAVDAAERARLQAAVIDTIEFSHAVLNEGAPGVLDPGLAAGLVALEAVIPLTTRLHVSGDVPADDPVASALWFVASEAVANSLKHADAHNIQISLRVDSNSAELTIIDDGCGGAGSPAAIARRLAAFDSTLEVASPPGGGTSIRASIPLATSRGAA